MFRIVARLRKWKLAERGFASTALIIIAIPLILGAFGYGFDTLRLVYAKRYLQGRLDLATQAGASIAYTNAQGNVRLGEVGVQNAAVAEANRVFLENTSNARPLVGGQSLIDCTTNDVQNKVDNCNVTFSVVGTAPRQSTNFCDDLPNSTADSVYGLGGHATDRVQTVFLRLIGVESWDLDVYSESLFRYRNC